jgi:hypothetical protein
MSGDFRSHKKYGVRRSEESGEVEGQERSRVRVRLGPEPKGQRLRGQAELYQAATFSL